MMNSPKLMLFLVRIVGFTCVVAQGQVDPNNQASVISEEVAVLQSARQSGLPGKIDPQSSIYSTILKLGEAKVSTQQAVNELVKWLFVSQERPYTTEKFSLIHVHPAARSLIAIGMEAAPALKSTLTATIPNDDAVLVLRCLQHIYKDDSAAQLQQLKSQAPSFVVTRAIDFVLGEPSETTGVQSKLEPEPES